MREGWNSGSLYPTSLERKETFRQRWNRSMENKKRGSSESLQCIDVARPNSSTFKFLYLSK